MSIADYIIVDDGEGSASAAASSDDGSGSMSASDDAAAGDVTETCEEDEEGDDGVGDSALITNQSIIPAGGMAVPGEATDFEEDQGEDSKHLVDDHRVVEVEESGLDDQKHPNQTKSTQTSTPLVETSEVQVQTTSSEDNVNVQPTVSYHEDSSFFDDQPKQPPSTLVSTSLIESDPQLPTFRSVTPSRMSKIEKQEALARARLWHEGRKKTLSGEVKNSIKVDTTGEITDGDELAHEGDVDSKNLEGNYDEVASTSYAMCKLMNNLNSCLEKLSSSWAAIKNQDWQHPIKITFPLWAVLAVVILAMIVMMMSVLAVTFLLLGMKVGGSSCYKPTEHVAHVAPPFSSHMHITNLPQSLLDVISHEVQRQQQIQLKSDKKKQQKKNKKKKQKSDPSNASNENMHKDRKVEDQNASQKKKSKKSKQAKKSKKSKMRMKQHDQFDAHTEEWPQCKMQADTNRRDKEKDNDKRTGSREKMQQDGRESENMNEKKRSKKSKQAKKAKKNKRDNK